jgi:acetyl-CoA carboxylase carboxyltransferase component
MEGDAAVQALHGAELRKYGGAPDSAPEELRKAIGQTRTDYERWLDALYAAARGHCDAVIDPKNSRAVLSFALELAAYGRHREHLVLETL